mgnify:CR=1 FL=1
MHALRMAIHNERTLEYWRNGDTACTVELPQLFSHSATGKTGARHDRPRETCPTNGGESRCGSRAKLGRLLLRCINVLSTLS